MNSDKIEKSINKNSLSQYTSNPTVKNERKWYFFDLSGEVLGRAAVEISRILRGKNNRDFIYNLDLGNHIVLINSDKVVLTGNKLANKKYYNYSGYPGGMRERNSEVMLKKYSQELVYRVIKGLMPHNRLSRQQLKRLFIYTGVDHPHKAQEKNFVLINKVSK